MGVMVGLTAQPMVSTLPRITEQLYILAMCIHTRTTTITTFILTTGIITGTARIIGTDTTTTAGIDPVCETPVRQNSEEQFVRDSHLVLPGQITNIEETVCPRKGLPPWDEP